MSTGAEIVPMPAQGAIVERAPVPAIRDRVTSWIERVEPTARLAESIANTEFVPAALRGKPAAITAAILYGGELGLGPMQSLQSIDVIDGRPAVSAEMGRSLAFAAGHEIYIEETTTQRCIARGRRSGSREWVNITWTMDDAKRAGLDGRQNWRRHPRRMLQARATSELCHLLFSDAIGGMPFTLEELHDDTDAAGHIGAEQPAERTAQRRRSSRRTAESAPAPTDEAAPPLPGDEPAPAESAPATPPADEPPLDGDEILSREQVKLIQTLYSGMKVTDRDERLASVAKIIGRQIASANDLTKAEASTLIDTLQKLGEGEEAGERLRALIAATPDAEQGSLPVADEPQHRDPVDA